MATRAWTPGSTPSFEGRSTSTARRALRFGEEQLLPGCWRRLDRTDLVHEDDVLEDVLRRVREYYFGIVEHLENHGMRGLVLRDAQVGIGRSALVLVDLRGGIGAGFQEGALDCRVLGEDLLR